MSIEDFTSDAPASTDQNEKSQQTESNTPATQNAGAPPQNSNTAPSNSLTPKQEKELKSMADQYDVKMEVILEKYNELALDPVYRGNPDPESRFELIKVSIDSEYEDIAELVEKKVNVLGKFTRYIPGGWNAALSQVIVKIAGETEARTLGAFEENGGKIYKLIQNADPFHIYAIQIGKNEWEADGKKVQRFELDERTRFMNGLSPRDSGNEKFAQMDEVQLLKHFFHIDVHQNIYDAGMSEVNKKGRPKPEDAKALRVIINPPEKTMIAGDDFTDLYTLKCKATDMEGNKIDVNFPPFKEWQNLIPAGGQRNVGIAIGPIGEYQGKPYIDAFNFIFTS